MINLHLRLDSVADRDILRLPAPEKDHIVVLRGIKRGLKPAGKFSGREIPC
jgi:hypothetical protein